LPTCRKTGPSTVPAAAHSFTAVPGQADRAPADCDHRACAFLVGLRPADGDAETFGAFLEVGDVERHEFGPPGGQCEAQQQQRAIALAGKVAPVLPALARRRPFTLP
jgi:hypothetical protein